MASLFIFIHLDTVIHYFYVFFLKFDIVFVLPL
jgi:hypothetical protein